MKEVSKTMEVKGTYLIHSEGYDSLKDIFYEVQKQPGFENAKKYLLPNGLVENTYEQALEKIQYHQEEKAWHRTAYAYKLDDDRFLFYTVKKPKTFMNKVFELEGLTLEVEQDFNNTYEKWTLSLANDFTKVKKEINVHLAKIILSGVYSYRPVCSGCHKPYKFKGSLEGGDYCPNKITEWGVEDSIGDHKMGWEDTMARQFNVFSPSYKVEGENTCVKMPNKETLPLDIDLFEF